MTDQKRSNILVIVSDEHAARFTGCYGHDIVQTPNLDRLADRGVRFDRAYCPSPVCTPSRMSFFTGRYPHEIGAWDLQAGGTDGEPTWGPLLSEAGYETILCGRTSLGDGDRDRGGFDRRLLDDYENWKEYDRAESARTREYTRRGRGGRSHVTNCGVDGDHWQLAYDRTATELAAEYLRKRGQEQSPWLAYVGLMKPHFPLLAPERLLSLYDLEEVDLAPTREEPIESQHPYLQGIRRYFRNETPLDEVVERRAMASYLALVTFVDEQVGRLLDALEASGQLQNTTVIYTSDHGEMAGHHGHWQKHCMYEPAVRVPLVVSGPGVPNETVTTNASLVDLTPTLCDLAGVDRSEDFAGESLLRIANGETVDRERDEVVSGRPVFGEYHDMGSTGAAYMIAKGRYKYVHYVDHEPQLFDLEADPDETENLIEESGLEDVRQELHDELRAVVDPQAVDAAAKADQRRRSEPRE